MPRPAPSSRGALAFGPARNGAVSRCDIVLDLSGGAPLFPAADLRDGYLRADPGDPAAVLRAVLKARDLVGTFDKPRYITFTEDLCAHSRSKIVGCRRCLDLCPTGAIAPNGDHVAIDAQICAGCGQCAAACPTGAAAYALPPADALMRKLRTLLGAYREAGGKQPVVLFHDAEHGARIDRRAGAPRRRAAGERAAGAGQRGDAGRPGSDRGGVCLWRVGACASCSAPSRATTSPASRKTIALAEPILAGLGFAGARVATIETDDPDALGAALARHRADGRRGQARDLRRRRRQARRDAAGACANCTRRRRRRSTSCALPQGAPFGTVEVNVEGCTLCLSCVSACPTGALSDDPERPMLRFAEDACVQCGLCKATCPEKVISLKPQLDFRAATAIAPHHQAGGAVRLRPLRQAVRRQEHGRARRRQARRQALDVQGLEAAARRHQDVRGLPRHRRWPRRISIPTARPRARPCAPPTIICASASELKREYDEKQKS